MQYLKKVLFLDIVLLCQLTVTFGQNLCLDSEFCARKCCPEGEFFNANSSQCQSESQTPSGTTNSSSLAICPGGRWSDDVTADSRHGVECVEHVREGESEAVKKALICFDGKENYSVLRSNVPLRKCCSNPDDIYNILYQNCQNKSEDNFSSQWPPPIHSISSIQQLNVSVDQIDLTFNLTDCPEGFVAQSTTDFIIFEDGSVEIPQTSSKFQSGEYCVENFVPDELHPNANFIVRFCVRDVCQSTNCVRKCCPEGYLITDETCSPSGSQFTPEFRNESRYAADVQSDSYVIRSGVVPDCPSVVLDPAMNVHDEFFILPSGKLKIPAAGRTLDKYCVDDFLENGKPERKAVICQDPDPPRSDELRFALAIFPYLLFLSAFFLLVTTLIAIFIPEKYIACHAASLAIAFIGFGVLQLQWNMEPKACLGFAIVVHFFFLSSFTWLHVISFDIWRVFRYLRPVNRNPNDWKRTRRFIFYSLYAWGVPLIIVATGQILDNVSELPEGTIRPKFGEESCWFPRSDWKSILVYLYIPISIILGTNVLFLILTAVHICMIKSDVSMARSRKKQNYVIAASLFVLMGASWVTEVITWALSAPIYYVLPIDIINILTGVFLFITLVRRHKIRRFLKEKFRPMLHVFRRGRFTIAKSFHSSSAPARRETYQPKASSVQTSSGNTISMTQLTKETNLEDIDLSA